MLCRRLAALALLFIAPRVHADKPRKPTPALPAAQYALHDTHTEEHVTVAAEPGDTPETRPNTRLDYSRYGFMPIRVIVTNESTRALTLDDARIHFVDANNTIIPAATQDELDRRLSSTANIGKKIPLPGPLPPITRHGKQPDKKILADDNDFGFPTTTVAPHATVSGYLYYDVRDLDDPVLAHATLELRRAEWADTKQQLESFEVALKPTAAKSANGSH
jgi:hypothetical protein